MQLLEKNNPGNQLEAVGEEITIHTSAGRNLEIVTMCKKVMKRQENILFPCLVREDSEITAIIMIIIIIIVTKVKAVQICDGQSLWSLCFLFSHWQLGLCVAVLTLWC